MKDLSVTQAGRALILSFTPPRLATDGRRLTKPLTVEIFRQITGAASQSAGGPGKTKPLKPFATIGPQELTRLEHGGKISCRMNLAAGELQRAAGARFTFHVVTLTHGFRSHPHLSEISSGAATEILDVSPPVKNLIARQVPHAVELKWSAPRASLTGGPLPPITGYRIYRRVQSQPGEPALVGETVSTSYQDAHFQFGPTYVYRVAAAFSSDGFTATSAASAPVEITPRAIFPPPPPVGLTAVYTGSSVELIWKPEIESGLAGYNVYRQGPGESGQIARRINPQLLRTPAFSDRAIQQGAKYIYRVTAVDTAHNESAQSARAVVETQQ